MNSKELSFGKSKVALKVPLFNFDNSPSAGFQLLKSPTTEAAFASFASIEKVTLTAGLFLESSQSWKNSFDFESNLE